MAKRILSFVLALAAIFSLAACSSGGSDDPGDTASGGKTRNDTNQVTAADDIFSLNCNRNYSFNPMKATNTNNQLVCCLIYENMVEVDSVYNVNSSVVDSWSSDDGITWTLKVDNGHTFHNGAAVTASDVAYSLRCAKGSERFSARLAAVADAQPADDETVTVTLSQANMLFPMLLSVPVIQYGTYEQTYPGGSGPYMYSSDYTSLVAFDKYKSAATLPIDTIYLKEYSGTEATISAFADSLIDVVVNDPSSVTDIGFGSANDIRSFNTTNMHYIVLNNGSTECSKEFFRFAMNYAFDREYVVGQLGGYAAAATLPINPSSSLYNEKYARQFDYDLNMVQKKLSEAGMKDYDSDGYLELKSGDSVTDFNISFLVYSGSSAKVNAAKRFADEMKSIGIEVTVNKQDWNNYCAALDAGNFDMAYCEVRLNADFDPSRLLATGGSLNYSNVADSQLDKLIADYLAADSHGRSEARDNMVAYIANKAYIVPLCFERHQLISHRGVIEGAKANENNPMCGIASWTIHMDAMVVAPTPTPTPAAETEEKKQ